MTKLFKIFVPVLLSVAIMFSLFPVKTFSASLLDSSQSCTMRIKSGWNLVSLAELTCGLMKLDASGSNELENFPAYLDIYGYDGSEYIYARVLKQDLTYNGGRSLESAVEKYLNKIVKKVSSNQYNNYNNDEFERSIEKDIEQNDTQKIKEYAGRLVKELFTSVWVYNSGRDISLEYSPRGGSDEEALAILAIRALITDTDSSVLFNYVETQILPTALRELERSVGYTAFLKEAVSGKAILDSGWNFLSYSRLLSDNNGNLNFSGNCNISKAYLFDNNSKKWISSQNVNRSMMGAGMVVYNSGAKCSLAPENSIISRMKSMLRGGADNLPPVLPN